MLCPTPSELLADAALVFAAVVALGTALIVAPQLVEVAHAVDPHAARLTPAQAFTTQVLALEVACREGNREEHE